MLFEEAPGEYVESACFFLITSATQGIVAFLQAVDAGPEADKRRLHSPSTLRSRNSDSTPFRAAAKGKYLVLFIKTIYPLSRLPLTPSAAIASQSFPPSTAFSKPLFIAPITSPQFAWQKTLP